MKKNEIALLILIVSICLTVGYFAGNTLLGGRTSKPVEVESAERISSEVTPPSGKVFNSEAINPTVPVLIGNSTNQQPFGN